VSLFAEACFENRATIFVPAVESGVYN